MSTIIHRNNAPRNKIVASNVLMGLGDNKNDNVEKRINDLEEKEVDVEVTPLLSEGVHIADIKVNNQTAEIYAPQGGGSGTVTDVLVDGVSVVNQDGEAEITMPSVPSDLDDLSDVNVSSLSDGEVLKYNATTDKWENGEAGGGNVDDVQMNGVSIVDANKVASFNNYVELTQAQYDALPASKLTDGILYCIKDTGIVEGDKYTPIIYSLEEREVGVWTDGKPLYQKSYYFANANNTTYTLEQTFNAVIQTQVGSWTDSGGYRRPMPYLETNLGVFAYTYNDKLLLQFSPYNATEVFVTVQYTKTTDVAGSGTWGTDGVPMVHYDGTERIIGTWFGETLYTKTYHYTGTLNSNTWVTIDSSRLPSNTPYFSVMNVCFISTELSSSAKFSAYKQSIPFDIAISTNEQLYFENKSNYKIYEFAVTIQYTKTT